jgi:hypothetical protein
MFILKIVTSLLGICVKYSAENSNIIVRISSKISDTNCEVDIDISSSRFVGNVPKL